MTRDEKINIANLELILYLHILLYRELNDIYRKEKIT